MLGLGIAASNVPQLYRPRAAWPAIYESWTKEGIPPPNELEQETEDVQDGYVSRIDKGFETLREQLEAYSPDVIVMLGFDDGTCFNGVQIPQLCTYTGAELTGSSAVTVLGEQPEDHAVTLKCNPEFAWEVHGELIEREFDMSYMSIQNPLGRPEMGTSSAFTMPATRLLKDLETPVLPILINCHVAGTGEVRAWITVAGAMEEVGTRAKVLDYIPARKSTAGIAYAYWQVGAPANV